VTQLPNTAHH